MRRTSAALIAACAFLCAKGASAHRIDEYLQPTILSLETHRVQASMRLIPGILVSPLVIAAIDSDGDGAFSESEERAYAQRVLGDLSITLDGKNMKPVLLSWSFPEPAQMREGSGRFTLNTPSILPTDSPHGRNRSLILANHHLNRSSVYLMNALAPQDCGIEILAQKRNEQQSFYELDYRTDAALRVPWDNLRAWLNGVQFSSLFRLGMRHIAEGTDHLLFLLVLLLPAPLLVSGQRGRLRWSLSSAARPSLLRILGIVTAFTIGHSITLTLAALNFVRVPSRPVEVLIAVSILVSAVRAWRPIFPGREAWIAAFFGLIHGLAFAATLDRLGLGRWDRVAGILSFNLGIEAMQMLVVAAILPSLMLLSRKAAYSILGSVAKTAFRTDASVSVLAEMAIRRALQRFCLLRTFIKFDFPNGTQEGDNPSEDLIFIVVHGQEQNVFVPQTNL